MEGVENERASSSDESDIEENGLKNAYSVGDLLGELSSDNDLETKRDGNDSANSVHNLHDSSCLDSNLSVDNVCNISSEKLAEVDERSATSDASVLHVDTFSRIYDEVLTEIIDQDAVETDGYLVSSKQIILIYVALCSQVVNVLDSDAVGPGFKSQPRCFQVTVLGKLLTPVRPLFTKQQNW